MYKLILYTVIGLSIIPSLAFAQTITIPDGFEIKDEQDYINTLLEIYHKQYTGPSAEAAVEQLFAPPERLKELVHPIDERVKEVISIIESNIDQNISIEVLARKVNLSVPHLVKIFKAQTGVPIRRYRTSPVHVGSS